jgi:hypothetical protein
MVLQDNAAVVSFCAEFNSQMITCIGAYVLSQANEPDHPHIQAAGPTRNRTTITSFIDRVWSKTGDKFDFLRRRWVTG